MKHMLWAGAVALGLAVPVALASPATAAEAVAAVPAAAVMHKLAIHVDEDDPARMNMALNNAQNARAYYEGKGETIAIEIVAYGPGLAMLRKDASPVADRISVMALENPNLTFSACGNTLAGMTKKAGHPIELLAEAQVTPSGVVRLMELQRDGYAYLRP